MIRLIDGLRLLLGAIFVLTALAWLIPPLVPFMPAQVWHDPMAARLMGTFDASGLLGVAKGIHLVAGLGLLLNRAVPFALAAAMPVNVCGAFIAALVESAPMGAVLALALVALNGLLMLAYIAAYRPMLNVATLTDGEGAAAGENYNSLFVHALGGTPRKSILIGLIPLLAAAAFYWQVVRGLNSITGLVVLAIPTIVLAAAWLRGRSNS